MKTLKHLLMIGVFGTLAAFLTLPCQAQVEQEWWTEDGLTEMGVQKMYIAALDFVRRGKDWGLDEFVAAFQANNVSADPMTFADFTAQYMEDNPDFYKEVQEYLYEANFITYAELFAILEEYAKKGEVLSPEEIRELIEIKIGEYDYKDLTDEQLQALINEVEVNVTVEELRAILEEFAADDKRISLYDLRKALRDLKDADGNVDLEEVKSLLETLWQRHAVSNDELDYLMEKLLGIEDWDDWKKLFDKEGYSNIWDAIKKLQGSDVCDDVVAPQDPGDDDKKDNNSWMWLLLLLLPLLMGGGGGLFGGGSGGSGASGAGASGGCFPGM